VKLYKTAVMARANVELKKKEKERMKSIKAIMEYHSSSENSLHESKEVSKDNVQVEHKNNFNIDLNHNNKGNLFLLNNDI
jgi:hypothetical protein